MKESAAGDGLFEAIRSEVRGSVKVSDLPDALLSFAAFDEWRTSLSSITDHNHCALTSLPSLFANHRLDITVNVEDLVSPTESAAHLPRVEVRLAWKKGKYYSNHDSTANPSLQGIKGLRFWLENFSVSIDSSNHSTAVFVVGTHKDQLNEADYDIDRTKKIVKFAKELGVVIDPAHVFEVSATTWEGIEELRQSIITCCRAMPHMGEQVPKDYLTIKSVVADLATSLSCHKSLSIISIQLKYSKEFLFNRAVDY
jgi:hypothetical protein